MELNPGSLVGRGCAVNHRIKIEGVSFLAEFPQQQRLFRKGQGWVPEIPSSFSVDTDLWKVSLPRRSMLEHRGLGLLLVLLLTLGENTPLCLKQMRMNRRSVSELL